MAAKIEAAHARLFKEMFICRRCGSKIKAQSRKVSEGKIRCRKCKGNVFKPKSRKVTK
jgi:formylmethanofuran dehydrogenase subunit E